MSVADFSYDWDGQSANAVQLRVDGIQRYAVSGGVQRALRKSNSRFGRIDDIDEHVQALAGTAARNNGHGVFKVDPPAVVI